MRIVTLTSETKQNLLENLLKRSTNDYGEYEKVVAEIIEQESLPFLKRFFRSKNRNIPSYIP